MRQYGASASMDKAEEKEVLKNVELIGKLQQRGATKTYFERSIKSL